MTELFAAIREDSKYFNQNPKALPFPVSIANTTDAYRVKGNGDQYRLEDVYLFVQSGRNFQQINKEVTKPAPNCGACPGDGTVCKTTCRHELESPITDL
ncbi:hypothetical protein MO867_18910 [Microbulbifer sp. OS29]|uniref:Uncharacterized protein n=1 Tax=Microbulbifer okhotskensis TaxID=2926617 RepID=A0A9X2EVV1_9GAMM|nr:hypothetical protein [Microbulbifer okhotskensis]MCO1336408.1 hypothetical protein [Microbulbifer okhotskensis]